MARSRRKRPFTGWTTAKSEKDDKKLANRKLRRVSDAAVRRDPEKPAPMLREVSDVWAFAKDGKMRIRTRSRYGKKLMRK